MGRERERNSVVCIPSEKRSALKGKKTWKQIFYFNGRLLTRLYNLKERFLRGMGAVSGDTTLFYVFLLKRVYSERK